MLRKLGWLLTILGLACLAWILYSWWTNQPVNSYYFLGVFGLVLGNTLLSRPKPRMGNDPDGMVSPSMRRQNKEHKSWIQNDRK